MSQPPCILFTAFEPSGDEHAASAIVELRKRLPDVPIHGFGGPRMAEAGAQIIEQTSGMGLMLADSAGHVFDHFRRVSRLKRWADEHPVAVHVPTDSPAANWSFCRMIKKKFAAPAPGRPAARVVHLVAPQVWAWAQWRVKRLQQWSDLVLCLLPFEPNWFAEHDVNARFIGHPSFDEPLDTDHLNWQAMNYPSGSPRIALLPGSRKSEMKANWPVLLDAFGRFSQRHPDAQAVVAAVDEAAAKSLRKRAGQVRANLRIVAGQTQSVIHWSQVVLTVSGTVSLQIARHGKPMAIVYRIQPLNWWLVGQWLVSTRTFTLPNLITLGRPEPTTAGHVVREFIPFWGPSTPIVDELSRLVDDADYRAAQQRALAGVVAQFEGHHAGREAATAIAEQYEQAMAAT